MEDTQIERVLLWMISGMAPASLENAIISKLRVDPTHVKGLISEARKRLTLAAEYNRDEMLGTALSRLNDLYARCFLGDGVNLAKALDVQKEINRLAGLYRGPGTTQSDGGTSEADAELAAIADYLFPLELTSPDYPIREHARLAAQRVRELT